MSSTTSRTDRGKVEKFRKTVEKSHPRCFDVDLTAPDNIRWREGHGPAPVMMAAE